MWKRTFVRTRTDVRIFTRVYLACVRSIHLSACTFLDVDLCVSLNTDIAVFLVSPVYVTNTLVRAWVFVHVSTYNEGVPRCSYLHAHMRGYIYA
jgi:hypothetical protein